MTMAKSVLALLCSADGPGGVSGSMRSRWEEVEGEEFMVSGKLRGKHEWVWRGDGESRKMIKSCELV